MTSVTGNRKKNNSRGFSLIEVLVAIVIFSAGICAVLYSFDASLAALSASRDRMRADSLARQKLDDFAWYGLSGMPRGEFSGVDDGFSWRIEVTPSSPVRKSALDDIVVTVRRGDDGTDRSLTTRIRPKRRPSGGHSGGN